MVVALVLVALIVTTAGSGLAQGNAAAERFVLSGVMLFEGEPGLAWLQEPSLTGDRVVAVRPGESVGPYRLTRILDDRVELEGPSGRVLVPIYNAQSRPGPAVASAAPGAAPSGVPAPGRSPRSEAAAPSRFPSSQPAASPQPDPASVAALRERVEAARERWEQAEQRRREMEAGQRREPARAERRPGGQAKASAPASNTSATSTSANNTSDVVYPERRQTFQSILGLD